MRKRLVDKRSRLNDIAFEFNATSFEPRRDDVDVEKLLGMTFVLNEIIVNELELVPYYTPGATKLHVEIFNAAGGSDRILETTLVDGIQFVSIESYLEPFNIHSIATREWYIINLYDRTLKLVTSHLGWQEFQIKSIASRFAKTRLFVDKQVCKLRLKTDKLIVILQLHMHFTSECIAFTFHALSGRHPIRVIPAWTELPVDAPLSGRTIKLLKDKTHVTVVDSRLGGFVQSKLRITDIEALFITE